MGVPLSAIRRPGQEQAGFMMGKIGHQGDRGDDVKRGDDQVTPCAR